MARAPLGELGLSADELVLLAGLHDPRRRGVRLGHRASVNRKPADGLRILRQSYDGVFPSRRNGEFTAVSGLLANAIKGNLQGFLNVAIITRNEGVRGSSPRVGFSIEEIPA